MSYEITVDASQLQRWALTVEKSARPEVQKFMNLALKNSANIVQRREAQEAPRGVTNQLAASIQQTVTTLAAVIGPDHKLDYPLYVETGTKPHMPPVKAITEWANAHGINPWTLALSIKKNGTKANKYVDRTYDATKPEVEAEFVATAHLITKFLARA